MAPEHGPHLTYVVADLHGRLDLLEAALAAIGAHGRGRAQTVVFLGDYVDRGPNSAGVLARLADGAPPGWRWICLKGNHEAVMAAALHDPHHLDWWRDNGGQATIVSYRTCRHLVEAHLTWIEGLPLLHEDAHRVFVHAGVDPTRPLETQDERTLLWKRYPHGDPRGHGDRHVVHGHTPDPDGPHVFAGRTALDTLAWHSGRLVVALFDAAQAGGPVELIEVR